MQQQFTDLISRFNQISIDTTKDLIDINTRAFEKFSQKQVELVSEGLEIGLNRVKAASEIKTLQDLPAFFSAQTDEMKNYGEKIQTSVQASMTMLTESSDELNTWAKKGMDAAAAVSTVKPAPAKPKKAA